MASTDKKDPGHCGLPPIETGEWDPFWPECAKHDEEYIKLKEGKETKSNLETQTDFAAGVFVTMAQGAYALLAGPAYILIGSLGGALRWLQIKANRE
jgi:hypothetical protein